MTVIRTVAFDARYVNDRYHGIGRHAYNLLEALTRLDPTLWGPWLDALRPLRAPITTPVAAIHRNRFVP